MILSHKIELKPNKEQEVQLQKSCGCARFSYNWGLAKWSQMYQDWKVDNTLPKPTANLLKKEFNKIKEVEFPWIYDSPKDANQQVFTNLGSAFKNFFNKSSNYPKFKKRGNNDSFYISNDKFTINENHIKLPKIGKVKTTEQLRFTGKIQSCIISKRANKWFASIAVELESYTKNRKSNNTTSIDFGLKTLITTNTGDKIQSPKPLKKYQNKLKLYQRKLSRKLKGSKNKNKQKLKVAKLHMKISNVRNDFTHKLTSKLCNENQIIIIEDLNVKSWMKKYGKSTCDSNIGETIRQLSYKTTIFNNILHKVDRWYPSTKTCSKCGYIKDEISLNERVFKCESCGFTLDRDYNAALNLHTVGLTEIYACGYQTSISSNSTTSKLDSRNKNLDNVKSCDIISPCDNSLSHLYT
jgi:putative transposase